MWKIVLVRREKCIQNSLVLPESLPGASQPSPKLDSAIIPSADVRILHQLLKWQCGMQHVGIHTRGLGLGRRGGTHTLVRLHHLHAHEWVEWELAAQGCITPEHPISNASVCQQRTLEYHERESIGNILCGCVCVCLCEWVHVIKTLRNLKEKCSQICCHSSTFLSV